jgi:small subunit ribosomal protein S15
VNITSENKQKLIAQFQRNPKDTGSEEVQISLLTKRIEGLTGHFQTHKKDHHSRRGLLGLVSRRRKLLEYLKRTDFPKYLKTIQELELRK